jgi:RNA polymerase sigma factor (sigma-70 family)
MAGLMNDAIRRVYRGLLRRDGGGRTDGELLTAFVERADEAAFEALVRRHGPMVLGVGRRVLGDRHAAEDVFQAAFLVLARKAAGVWPRDAVGNWLYGVAVRIARDARRSQARRRAREVPMFDCAQADMGPRETSPDWRPILDDELSRLPDHLRLPILLCDVEGRTRRAAARELRLPDGTFSRRLAAARRALAGRLARRGVTLGFAGLAAALARDAAAGTFAPAFSAVGVPAHVKVLARNAEVAMRLNRIKFLTAILATVLSAGVVGTLLLPPANGQPAKAPLAPPQQQPVFKFPADAGTVVWSADAKTAATLSSRHVKREGGGDDDYDHFTTVRIWDATTGKERHSFGEVKNSHIASIALSPDGKLLGLSYRHVISQGDEVEIWDALTGLKKDTIKMDYGRIIPRLTFSPDGKTVAVVYGGPSTKFEGGVRLWDVATGKLTQYLAGHKSLVMTAKFSPDGNRIATGGDQNDQHVRVWDRKNEKAILTAETGALVWALAFSPDGKHLATALADGNVPVWDVQSGKQVRVLKTGDEFVRSVAFSPDGRFLAAESTSDVDKKRVGKVTLWDARSAAVLATWEKTAGLGVVFPANGGGVVFVDGERAVVRKALKFSW